MVLDYCMWMGLCQPWPLKSWMERRVKSLRRQKVKSSRRVSEETLGLDVTSGESRRVP